MPSFTYSPDLGRYRDAATGRLVSEARVRLAVDHVADAASDLLADLTTRLVRGDISLARWQAESMRVIKVSHLAAGVVAQGGKAQMTPADYGAIGRQLRDQYAYLRKFANGIEAGTVPLDGRMVARAGMYGQAARSTFTRILARQRYAIGYVSERNILGASDHHCDACLSATGRGWVPIGRLIPPGSRMCLGRCRCRLAYSKVEAEAVA